jgi:uridine kinase
MPFNENRVIKYQRYDWPSDILKDWVIIPESSNIIVEGVFSGRKELTPYYNLKIWIDCPDDIRLKRGVERDGLQIKEYWQNVWMKQEKEYYDKHKPFLSADFRISSNSNL